MVQCRLPVLQKGKKWLDDPFNRVLACRNQKCFQQLVNNGETFHGRDHVYESLVLYTELGKESRPKCGREVTSVSRCTADSMYDNVIFNPKPCGRTRECLQNFFVYAFSSFRLMMRRARSTSASVNSNDGMAASLRPDFLPFLEPLPP